MVEKETELLSDAERLRSLLSIIFAGVATVVMGISIVSLRFVGIAHTYTRATENLLIVHTNPKRIWDYILK